MLGLLLILVYIALLIGGLILAVFMFIARFFIQVAAALIDRDAREPEVIEPQPVAREVVAVRHDPRSISEKRLDRYCGTC